MKFQMDSLPNNQSLNETPHAIVLSSNFEPIDLDWLNNELDAKEWKHLQIFLMTLKKIQVRG